MEIINGILLSGMFLCAFALVGLVGAKFGFDKMDEIHKPVEKATKDYINALESNIKEQDNYIKELKRINDELRLKNNNLRVYIRELHNGNG